MEARAGQLRRSNSDTLHHQVEYFKLSGQPRYANMAYVEKNLDAAVPNRPTDAEWEQRWRIFRAVGNWQQRVRFETLPS